MKTRARQILSDKYLKPLVYLIGKENGMSPKETDKIKHTQNFEDMIVSYLESE